MKIAKIVSSNSHIDYIARVIDTRDTDAPPVSDDHCFGQFVVLGDGDEQVVGVIYDSRLVNPEYGSFGPRIAPHAAHVNPDFVHEQGILIGILLLGSIAPPGKALHGIPPRIVPSGSSVRTMGADEIISFHSDGDGRVHLHYYSQVIANAGQFAIPLLASIIDQLSENSNATESQRLSVLKDSLMWQGTFGGMKL